jgi:hypothetical protein
VPPGVAAAVRASFFATSGFSSFGIEFHAAMPNQAPSKQQPAGDSEHRKFRFEIGTTSPNRRSPSMFLDQAEEAMA